MSWVISDNMIKFNQIIGSSFLSPAYGLGGARATILSFCLSVPPSARKKFWLSPPPLKLWRAGIQAGEKEGGRGEGIFARLFCAIGAVGWEAFPPSWYQDIPPNRRTGAAKQFSNPFKRKRVTRKIKELKRKLFCFARRVSAGGNAGAGFQIIRAIFARKRFELRSAIATNLNFFQNQDCLVARSPAGVYPARRCGSGSRFAKSPVFRN